MRRTIKNINAHQDHLDRQQEIACMLLKDITIVAFLHMESCYGCWRHQITGYACSRCAAGIDLALDMTNNASSILR